MITQLDNVAAMRADSASKEQARRPILGDLVARVREVLRICDRAGSAAHRYEQQRAQSDEALAEEGLKRSDLPRKAFDETTG